MSLEELKLTMRNFESLLVWKESRQLVKDVYFMMSNCKDYGLKDQIQRASVSIMNNIAEGSEAGSDLLFIRYLNISKASCAEVRSMFYLCEDIKICTPEEAYTYRDRILKIASGIQKMIFYLKRQTNND
ncbi:MAG: four helix bundle protein [Paludibacter sp.]|nr:four helix bundle protein [Paludibacter sp.]MDD4428497.1 four helix bundle protein [Paludibacter sp.]